MESPPHRDEHAHRRTHRGETANATPPSRHEASAGARNAHLMTRRFTFLESVGLGTILFAIIASSFAAGMVVTKRSMKGTGQTATSAAPSIKTNTSGTAKGGNNQQQQAAPADQELLAKVLPAQGVELPVTWGDLGSQMVKAGVIDQQKFEALYSQRGGLTPEMKSMLEDRGNGKIRITPENAPVVLNLLWALGLGNKNDILDKGEMQEKQFGGAGKFASTGGWTLAQGDTMQHYSQHTFIRLTPEQQALVDRVSKNIYRPCCGNSTHFPDCNHGMAMLGLLELMASQGVSEQEMYRAALAVNSYWFPDTYVTIASYFKAQGTDWSQVDPQSVLSSQYSSAQGYRQLLTQISPQNVPSKGGCGI